MYDETYEVSRGIFKFVICIAVIAVIIVKFANTNIRYAQQDNYIKQLKQSLTEQVQECEVYRNRCKTLEEQMIAEGLVVDNCECR